MTQTLDQVLKELKQMTGLSLELKGDCHEDTITAATELQKLCNAYKEKYDKTHFLQNLLRGESSVYEINEHAAKLHLIPDETRAFFLLETDPDMSEMAVTILKMLHPELNGNIIFQVSDSISILLYASHHSHPSKDELIGIARTIIDMLNTEALISAKISCGPVLTHFSELSAAYEQSTLALKVGKLFHAEQAIYLYDHVGLGRLISSLPQDVCMKFLNEVFLGNIPESLEPELLSTLNRFLQNNLNIAETARQLHMHRNTLIYRIEQLEKRTGLDLRNFEDAMTFKLALMVINYINS